MTIFGKFLKKKNSFFLHKHLFILLRLGEKL